VSEQAADDTTAKEILVVDMDATVLKGLETLFKTAGVVVTGVGTLERAKDQIANRFFSVALVDLDTPAPLAGLDLLAFAAKASPLTKVVVMTARPGHEAVAPAFRAGAADVVLKTQAQVLYIRDRVVTLMKDINAAVERDKLLAEVSEVHEEFLQKLMDLQRQVTDLEDKILNRDRDADVSVTAALPGIINVLLVDDEPGLPVFLEHALPSEEGWQIRLAQSGGEALDLATQTTFQLAVVKEQLPDLLGSMVVKTIKASAPDIIAVLFTPPRGQTHGEVKVVESSRLHSLIPSFSDPRQLVTALGDLREALRRKSHERRYFQVFRKQHLDFLKRYNAIKQKIAKTGP
jgi:DNA-binding NtrC family response regulator